MTDWQERLAAPVAAAEHGVDEADMFFESTHNGPITFNRISYPAAQVYMDAFERAGPTEWDISVSTILYFVWGRDMDFIEDITHPLAAIIDETLAAFEAVECITDYHPARIDFFSGEPNSDLILAMSIQFNVSTLLDPGEF